VRRFFEREIEPYYKDWERQENGYPFELWRKAGKAGLVGLSVPEQYGGPGCDALYGIIAAEESGRFVSGASLGPSVFGADHLTKLLVESGTEEQKRKYFPGILAGEIVQTGAISEPGAGSDVNAMISHARRDGDGFILNGQKIFITGGMHANLCYLVAKTDQDIERGRGHLTMFIVEMDTPGITRRRLDTLGVKAGDLAELFFDDVRVPASAMLGPPGGAMRGVLSKIFTEDRVLLACRALAVADLALDLTIEYTKNRIVFGKRVFDFQNTQFKLAELKANIVVGEGFRRDLLHKFVCGTLDDLTCSAAKYWMTELEFRTTHECLQLHGGYGYITETPINTLFSFARLDTLHAGTSEIHKGNIARQL
jgi:alkylation response protein AidB-like acyl-CoA dehydrogenase